MAVPFLPEVEGVDTHARLQQCIDHLLVAEEVVLLQGGDEERLHVLGLHVLLQVLIVAIDIHALENVADHVALVADEALEGEARGRLHPDGLGQGDAALLDAVDERAAHVLVLDHLLEDDLHQHARGDHDGGGHEEDEDQLLRADGHEDLVEGQEPAGNEDARDADQVGHPDTIDIGERRVAQHTRIGPHHAEAHQEEEQIHAERADDGEEMRQCSMNAVVEREAHKAGDDHDQRIINQHTPIRQCLLGEIPACNLSDKIHHFRLYIYIERERGFSC